MRPRSRPKLFVDRYKFEGIAGEGALSVVHKAKDIHTQKTVALKILRDSGNPIATGEQYLNEVQALQRVSNPSVVSLIDHGFHYDTPYLAIEFVQGTMFHEYDKKDMSRSLHTLLSLFSKVCDAVQSVHSAGLVHRDIKQNNIFVTGVNGSREIKLFDFGFAKRTGCNLPDVYSPAGTLEFMAPEQTQPHLPADPRSDVYSMGVLLYVMLSGKYPFDFTKNTRNQLPRLHRSEPPKPLIPKEFSSDIMLDEVCDIAMTALRKKPRDRFQSAAEMKARIDAATQALQNAA